MIRQWIESAIGLAAAHGAESVAGMRLVMLTNYLRATIAISILFLAYGAIGHAMGMLTMTEWYAILAAFGIAFFGSNAVLVVMWHTAVRSALYLFILVAAIIAGNCAHGQIGEGHCAIYLAIPIVLAPGILPPYSALIVWFVVTATSLIICQILGHTMNLFPNLALLLLAIAVSLSSSLREGLVRRINQERSTLEQALDVVIEYEANAVSNGGHFDDEFTAR